MTLAPQIDMSGVPVIPTRRQLAKEPELSQSRLTEQNEPTEPVMEGHNNGTLPLDSASAPLGPSPPPPLSTLPEIEKIITDDKRGDPGALSDAINQIYFLMYESNKSLQSYRSFSEGQFQLLNEKFENVNAGLEKAKTNLGEHDRALKKLKTDMAPKKDLKNLEQNLDTFKKTCDDNFINASEDRRAL